MMIQQITQRLHEVNGLLASCKSGRITFEQAMLLSLFYKDFNETNQIVTEAAAIFQEDEELLNEILSVYVNQFFHIFYYAKLNANRLYNLTQKCIIDNNTVNFTL